MKFVLFVNARKSAATHLKTPRPNTHHNTHKTAHINHPMARTKNIEQHKFSLDQGGDDDHCRGGEGNRRKSKRNTTTNKERDESTSGSPINKKSKATTQGIDEQINKDDTETPINRKQNDGDDDNANRQSCAMDEKVTEEGISTKNECDDDNAKAQHGMTNETTTVEGESTGNNGDTTNNNDEGGQINTNDGQGDGSKETDKNPTLAVRKPSFSNLEKHVISSNTNISTIFVITRALNLQKISSSHKAVVNKQRVVPLVLQR